MPIVQTQWRDLVQWLNFAEETAARQDSAACVRTAVSQNRHTPNSSILTNEEQKNSCPESSTISFYQSVNIFLMLLVRHFNISVYGD